jgi:hypothetical protein
MKRDPQKLREQAKKLLTQADKIENERAVRIGKLVLKYAENNFADFELEKLKKEVRE